MVFLRLMLSDRSNASSVDVHASANQIAQFLAPEVMPERGLAVTRLGYARVEANLPQDAARIARDQPCGEW